MKKRTPIYGVGINDSSYPVCTTKNKKIDGKNVVIERWECHFYSTWRNMLQRCYSESYQNKNQSYMGATVCSAWLTFSNFKAWMEKQDWQGKHLDKDLLGDGSEYAPDKCVFISPEINYFMRDERLGKYKIGSLAGAFMDKSRGKWFSACSSGGLKVNLGRFDTEMEAHLAWKTEKLKQAKILAERIKDKRLAEALIRRYS